MRIYSVCTLTEIQQRESKIKFNKHFCLETLIFYCGAISYFLEHTSTEHHLFQINKHMNILKLSVQSENITTKPTTPPKELNLSKYCCNLQHILVSGNNFYYQTLKCPVTCRVEHISLRK